MPTVISDLGSNSVAVAALAGVVSTNVPLLLLGTDSGLVGPLDEGTGVTCTVTQGANTVVLTMADGTGARASGSFLDLFAPFPLPMPAGFTVGSADTIVWTGSTGGVPFAFSQTGRIPAPFLSAMDSLTLLAQPTHVVYVLEGPLTLIYRSTTYTVPTGVSVNVPMSIYDLLRLDGFIA